MALDGTGFVGILRATVVGAEGAWTASCSFLVVDPLADCAPPAMRGTLHGRVVLRCEADALGLGVGPLGPWSCSLAP